MRRVRVIPILLMKNEGLVKTRKFKNPIYIGDTVNAIKIFNEKEIDELIILDIEATRQKRSPDLLRIKEIAGECFMPVCYGGGITSLKQIEAILNAGVEKVSLNASAFSYPELISSAAKEFGNQSVVVSCDIKKKWNNSYQLYSYLNDKSLGNPFDFLKTIENMGAGEILLTLVNNEGCMNGYDLNLLTQVTKTVRIPVIVNGGAGSILDFKNAVTIGGASAVAAGSYFVFSGNIKGVLINYPKQETLKEELFNKI